MDAWGDAFVKSLDASGVLTQRVRAVAGAATSRCAVMTGSSGRTMRTAMSAQGTLTAAMLEDGDMEGAKWCVCWMEGEGRRTREEIWEKSAWSGHHVCDPATNQYILALAQSACFMSSPATPHALVCHLLPQTIPHRVFLSAYCVLQPGLLQAAALQARRQGVRVMLDLASWDTLRAHAADIRQLQAEQLVDCCVCNEVDAEGEEGAREGQERGSHTGVRTLCHRG